MSRVKVRLRFTSILLGPLIALGCGDGSGPNDGGVPAALTITPGSVAFVSFGETQQLAATVTDAAGGTISATVVWNSSDGQTVTVSSSGLAAAVKDGSVTITATAGTATDMVTATVSQAIASVAVSPSSLLLMEGFVDQLAAEAQDALGNAVAGAAIEWSSPTPGVATVDAATGAITGVAAGAVAIAAASGGISGTGDVTVVGQADATLSNGVQPILSGNCALSGCHTGANPPQGLNLSSGNTFSNVVNVGSGELPSMNRVTPNQPNQSYLVHKIQGTNTVVGGSGGQMPLNESPLSDLQIAIVRAWILGGALNN